MNVVHVGAGAAIRSQKKYLQIRNNAYYRHCIKYYRIGSDFIDYRTVLDLERVLSGEQMDDLECVLYNPHGHQLLA
jgi:hypothetical protein